ncbi:MAG TPA: phosphoribosyltransferase family protein [Methanofastidiosum sp.]|nr:phosphoribosyltransferase family protein [Methanofastidiosum sp.]
MDTVYLEWGKVDEAIWTMCDAIKRDYDFDVIVGIARGGLIPAVRISHIFDDKRLLLIEAKYYKDIGVRDDKPKITMHLKEEDISGKKILLVDDVLDTGGTLVAIKEYIRGLFPKELRVAVIASKPISQVKPDYAVFNTDKWIIFPWEKMPVEKNK